MPIFEGWPALRLLVGGGWTAMTRSLLKRSLLALALILPMAVWADFQAGLDAYNRGDFAEAYKQMRPPSTTSASCTPTA